MASPPRAQHAHSPRLLSTRVVTLNNSSSAVSGVCRTRTSPSRGVARSSGLTRAPSPTRPPTSAGSQSPRAGNASSCIAADPTLRRARGHVRHDQRTGRMVYDEVVRLSPASISNDTAAPIPPALPYPPHHLQRTNSIHNEDSVEDTSSEIAYLGSASGSNNPERQYYNVARSRNNQRHHYHKSDTVSTSSRGAFKEIISDEMRKSAKLTHSSADRTLLVLLEEERSKYLQLESQYTKLLGEVQALQSSHLAEVRNLEKKNACDMRSLQKALVLKAEESAATQRELASLNEKHAREKAAWAASHDALDSHVARLKRTAADADEAAARHAQRARELADTHSHIEATLRAERDSRHRIELELSNAQHNLKAREAELANALQTIKQRDADLAKRTSEVEELLAVRAQLSATRRDLENLVSREKDSGENLRKVQQQKHQLEKERDELATTLRNTCIERDSLAQERQLLADDVAHVRDAERSLRADVEQLKLRDQQQIAEIDACVKRERRTASDHNRIQRELADTQRMLAESKRSLEELQLRYSDLQQRHQNTLAVGAQTQANADATADVLRRERDELHKMQQALQTQLSKVDRERAKFHAEVVRLDNENARLQHDLAEVTASKDDFQARSKGALSLVQQKLNGLQQTLQDTQSQLQDLRDADAQHRIIIAQQEQLLGEYRQRISDLESEYSREQLDKEQVLARKREEMLVVQDKVLAARAAMESEITQLKSQLAHQASLTRTHADENTRLQATVTDLQSQITQLESRVTKLVASEAASTRALDAMQSQLSARESELSRAHARTAELVEHVRALSSEAEYARTITATKDTELQRLQSSVGELTRRLKSQVELLIGNEMGTGNYTYGALASNGPSATSRSRAGSTAPPHNVGTPISPRSRRGTSSGGPAKLSDAQTKMDEVTRELRNATLESSSSSAIPRAASPLRGTVFPPQSAEDMLEKVITGLSDGDF